MSELRTNRIVPRDGLPSGSYGGIIQVRHVSSTSVFSTTDTSFTVVPLTLTITPTRADSAILLMLSFNGNNASSGGGRLKFNITRTVGGNESSIVTVNEALVDYGASNIHVQGLGSNYIDTGHNTTSEVTYKFKIATHNGTMVQVNNNGRSDFIAMEVSG